VGSKLRWKDNIRFDGNSFGRIQVNQVAARANMSANHRDPKTNVNILRWNCIMELFAWVAFLQELRTGDESHISH
jgi:hypothetical protein